MHQLNQPASDGLVGNRWPAWIRLFGFDLQHVLGAKHGGPDSLSRRERGEYESESEGEKDMMEKVLDTDLSALIGDE